MTDLRPPATPLVTHHPYFTVWSTDDRLTDGHTRHWTGRRHGLVGIARIDGEPMRFAGRVGPDEDGEEEADGGDEEPPAMDQERLDVRPLSTAYEFVGGGVTLSVTFTSPLLLDDLETLSRPASYVTITARSNDGADHDVRLYLDATAEWCVDEPDQAVTWSRTDVDGLDAMRVGTEEQDVLGHVGDDVAIDWGHLYVVPPADVEADTAIGPVEIRREFVERGTIPDADDEDHPRPVESGTPVLASAFDLDVSADEERSTFLTVGYDESYAVEYFEESVRPYWRRDGTGPAEMLATAISEYEDVLDRCAEFEANLLDESAAVGGEAYADVVSLAYRQSIAAHGLVEYDGDVLFLSKECFSNGCIGTVDVSYPSVPLYLLYEPELVRGMLRPIFRYARSDEWDFEFAPHDVGTYPKANGQVYRSGSLEDQMPIEECGNMLIMTAATCLVDDDPTLAEDNWDLLTQWAEYLLDNGLDPGEQLCTDDFAGHMSHNANLSIKAIVGIASYGLLCELRGDGDDGERYRERAAEMADRWTEMADDGDRYRLAFDQPDTWSLKYNLVWDLLFELGLFDPAVREREVETYLAEQNEYGTPLDSRDTYTKTDWLVWSACLADAEGTFEELLAPIRTFLDETPDRVPFTDWYDTESGEQVGFQHRSVIGGVFMKLLAEREPLADGPRS